MIVSHRKLAGLVLSCALPLIAAAMITPGVVGQTTPGWPKTDKKYKYSCKGNGDVCTSCTVAGTTTGCSATLAGTSWGSGWCEADDSVGEGLFCERTNFPCGAAVTCSSGNPTGNTCSTLDYCKDGEG